MLSADLCYNLQIGLALSFSLEVLLHLTLNRKICLKMNRKWNLMYWYYFNKNGMTSFLPSFLLITNSRQLSFAIIFTKMSIIHFYHSLGIANAWDNISEAKKVVSCLNFIEVWWFRASCKGWHKTKGKQQFKNDFLIGWFVVSCLRFLILWYNCIQTFVCCYNSIVFNILKVVIMITFGYIDWNGVFGIIRWKPLFFSLRLWNFMCNRCWEK